MILKVLEGNIKTSIVCSEDESRVFEVKKELDRTGDYGEALLITLYPTMSDVYSIDSTTLHLLNHMEDLHLKIVHIAFLFSRVQTGRLSASSLCVDVENLEYLKTLLQNNPQMDIIVSFGSSMSKNQATIESKMRLFEMIHEVCPEKELYQLDAAGLREDCAHVLFVGIRHANATWGLKEYQIPRQFTLAGYNTYLKEKELGREKRLKKITQKKTKVSPTQKAEDSVTDNTADSNADSDTVIAIDKGKKKKGKLTAL